MKNQKSRAKTKKSRRSYHHGDLRNALIQQAVLILDARKDAVFTIRELATQLGVTHAAAYQHFSGRPELLTAVAEKGIALFVTGAQPMAVRVEKDPWGVLKSSFRYFVKFAAENPGYFRAIFHPEIGAPNESKTLAAARAERYAAISGLVGLCLGPRARPEKIRDAAIACWSAQYGMAKLIVDEQLPGPAPYMKFDIDAAADALAESIIQGIK